VGQPAESLADGNGQVMELSPGLSDAIGWLEKQSRLVRYGTVAIAVTLHAGEVRRIERTISESMKEASYQPDALPEEAVP
jgi:hypothetical protein